MRPPRHLAALLLAASLSGCAAKDARQPLLELRFYELAEGGQKERSRQREHLNATLIRGARLQHGRAVELLGAAETPEGGSPQKLMQAGRTLTPGDGVVLLGTVRQGGSGGSVTSALVLQVALACSLTSLDSPGQLENCAGYVMRVPRQWPAEVYDVQGATVSILPEGGAARGRVRARSDSGAYLVELDGEFSASLVEYAQPAPLVER